ncbi:cytochrome-c peroxidase [Anaeromyxobacter terrae]|uniref:cytochrome-c peroxidase n=1 Tax=Anaeromyxobacter terrae TaxID=2925406 RepID=UPI001F572222|nr:cytochrome c peroxidase [Anaeromyxobacter sp. SG22]
MNRARPASLALLVLALSACRSADVRPAAAPGSPPAWEAGNPLRPLPAPPLGSPADFSAVPWVTPEKVRLGRWLFYDPRLSADGTISCATCHRPEHAFSEPTAVSTGIRGQQGRRKSPPIVNAAWPVYPRYFWDGRAASLAEQAQGPLANPLEMGNTLDHVVLTVSRIPGYGPYFREAFGDARFDIARVSEAIAAYEATRLSGNSAYDRFAAGDEAALAPEARHGMELFFGRAQCAQCHLGPNLSDSQFHNLGVGWRPPRSAVQPLAEGFADKGRYEVTRDEKDVGAFKTPTLRDCSKHAPYMHDGSMATLEEAVLHYWRGGFANPWLSERIVPVPMTRAELSALVAFLRSLDGEGYADVAPRAFPQ